jgi:hypothetical protein
MVNLPGSAARRYQLSAKNRQEKKEMTKEQILFI